MLVQHHRVLVRGPCAGGSVEEIYCVPGAQGGVVFFSRNSVISSWGLGLWRPLVSSLVLPGDRLWVRKQRAVGAIMFVMLGVVLTNELVLLSKCPNE